MANMTARDWAWRFWFTVPIYPYGTRRTLRTEVVPDTIWTFDQLQGILYVVTPVRMTVVKLAAGGLLVYAPVAPTRECMHLMNELVAMHGAVQYIVLPTISGLEHKACVGPFARHFPTAQVYVAPSQWSFPLNLPLSWLGFPSHRTYILTADAAPFSTDFDYAILGPLDLGLGKFGEVALYHRQSRTLLLTDTIVAVPAEAPAIAQLDPTPLLFHAKNSVVDIVTDTAVNRRIGWQRIALFAFYFRPSALQVVEFWQSIRDAQRASDRSKSAYWGWFPFDWQVGWQQSFAALRGDGRPFVAPILQALILNREPQTTLAWVDRVASWDFQQIIPCHFESPIVTTPQQFRQAFAFLASRSPDATDLLPEADFALLRQIDHQLMQRGITPPTPHQGRA
jgi:Domain of unknown function (DUF4336)